MAAQLLLLPLDVLPAVDDQRAHADGFAHALRNLRDLDGQLARRRDDESLRHIGLRLDFLEDWQQEGQRLARARLRLRDAVAARPHHGDGLFLHGRRLLDALIAQDIADLRRDAQFLE